MRVFYTPHKTPTKSIDFALFSAIIQAIFKQSISTMQKIINIAIIAHVDHGKTTLTDEILKQCNAFGSHEEVGELIMDSQDQERERGITITAKNCSAIMPNGIKLNILDTPGHADFGSEVERVLGMADAALLVVDAFEGPMPQTRFVLKHALERGLKIIVIMNKIDKPHIQDDEMLGRIFDLFIELGASDEQCDFTHIYAIGRDGRAGYECNIDTLAPDLTPLFETIEKEVTPKAPNPGLTQIQISALAYDQYLGRICVGRVSRGDVKAGQELVYENSAGETRKGRIQKLFSWEGIKQLEVKVGECHDIVGIAGFPDATIGDTLCAEKADPLPRPKIEEPTLEVVFYPNTSPFVGREGKFVTSRQIAERLERELISNVGLKVKPQGDSFKVAGRGELHIGVLLESMRREGYELAVGKPQVLINEKGEEPYEEVFIDLPENKSGNIIEQLGKRKGEMKHMETVNGRIHIQYHIPTRGLLGFRNSFIVQTGGEGILTSSFLKFGPPAGAIDNSRNGAMISGNNGQALGYALDNLQQRATLFIEPGDQVYEGMIIGECNRDENLTVNPTKGKQLTNVRASGTDEAIKLTPKKRMTLEQSMEWIADDELLEITPENLRLRKKLLTEMARKRSN